ALQAGVFGSQLRLPLAEGSFAVESCSPAVDLADLDAQLLGRFGYADSFCELEGFLFILGCLFFVLLWGRFLAHGSPLGVFYPVLGCPLLVVGIRPTSFTNGHGAISKHLSGVVADGRCAPAQALE